uniref:WSC domain-containing protein n=1 Tax=Moniliophthora roreri TaxID=221103 RepID=A0A0W0GFC0_MONRR
MSESIRSSAGCSSVMRPSNTFAALLALSVHSTMASPTLHARTAPDIVGHYGTWNHAGCFVDTPQRILPNQQDLSGKNTVEACLDVCAKYGFSLAGVEYGDQCFCGTTLNSQATLADGHAHACNMTCTANPHEVCGGSYAINVYEHAQPLSECGNWTLVGCAAEPKWREGEPRNLPFHPDQNIPISEMTVEKCLAGCARSHYTCAGLEYGQECCK